MHLREIVGRLIGHKRASAVQLFRQLGDIRRDPPHLTSLVSNLAAERRPGSSS